MQSERQPLVSFLLISLVKSYKYGFAPFDKKHEYMCTIYTTLLIELSFNFLFHLWFFFFNFLSPRFTALRANTYVYLIFRHESSYRTNSQITNLVIFSKIVPILFWYIRDSAIDLHPETKIKTKARERRKKSEVKNFASLLATRQLRKWLSCSTKWKWLIVTCG